MCINDTDPARRTCTSNHTNPLEASLAYALYVSRFSLLLLLLQPSAQVALKDACDRVASGLKAAVRRVETMPDEDLSEAAGEVAAAEAAAAGVGAAAAGASVATG